MMAKLTLAGLDRWTKSGMYEGSGSLWDLLTVPDGVDKDTLINAILYKSFEFPVAYMNAESVREQIGLLSSMWQESMNRTWEALTAEYNPIHNFDRYEEYTDESTGTESGTQTGTGETRSSGKTTTTANGTTSDNGGQVQSYMGDTATTYSPASKVDTSNNGTTSDTGEATSSDTGTSKTTQEDTRNTSGNSKHDGHLYGNVGVTTSQQMLEAEIDLRLARNWFDIWADKFTQELCIGIY